MKLIEVVSKLIGYPFGLALGFILAAPILAIYGWIIIFLWNFILPAHAIINLTFLQYSALGLLRYFIKNKPLEIFTTFKKKEIKYVQ